MLITFVLVFLFGGFVLSSRAFSSGFQKNLKFGDTDSDVIVLQQVLNSNPLTAVALSGTGSAGHEAKYFGSLTKNAVIRFQNLYASEILIPSGLSKGNGFVGQITRNKLNQLLLVNQVVSGTATPNKIIAIVASSTNQDLSVASTTQNQVVVFSVSPYMVQPGAEASIEGRGFTSKNNSVYLNGNLIGSFNSSESSESANSTTTRYIYFKVPTTLAEGVYNVTVTNSNGDSKTTDEKNGTIMRVRIAPAVPPEVISISPTVASTTDTIVITGLNFLPTSNTISSTFGQTTADSPDGTHLKFKLSSFDSLKLVTSRLSGDTSQPKHSMDLTIYVTTIEGTSKKQATLKVEF